jgi:CRISPR/Cas system-associated endonuclease Cas1
LETPYLRTMQESELRGEKMIVQHLVIDQYGAFLAKHSERLIVTKGDEKLAQVPLIHLESVVIANRGVSLSAEAVRECTERGIPIFFISGTGTAYAAYVQGSRYVATPGPIGH